jgi:hypothetical protein
MRTSEIAAFRRAVGLGEFGIGLEAQAILELCDEVVRLSDIICGLMMGTEASALQAEAHLQERTS